MESRNSFRAVDYEDSQQLETRIAWHNTLAKKQAKIAGAAAVSSTGEIEPIVASERE